MSRVLLFGFVSVVPLLCVAGPAFGQTSSPAPAFSTAPPSSAPPATENPPLPAPHPATPPPMHSIAPQPGDVTIGGPGTTQVGANAPASPPVHPYESTPGTHTSWYGWQTLIVDGASIGIGLGITAGGNVTAGLTIWQVGYALGAPVVHWSHGHFGKGWGSLGLRLAAPLALGLTGLVIGSIVGASTGSANDNVGDDYESGGALEGAAFGTTIGFFSGEVAAIVLDSVLIARETVPDDPSGQPSAPPPAAAFTWGPDFGVVRNRATVGGVGGAAGGLGGISGTTLGIAGTF